MVSLTEMYCPNAGAISALSSPCVEGKRPTIPCDSEKSLPTSEAAGEPVASLRPRFVAEQSFTRL